MQLILSFAFIFANCNIYLTIIKLMLKLPEVHTSDFIYDLPSEKIAYYPVNDRLSSKLLVYKNNDIVETKFGFIANYLDNTGIIVLNDTKVIPARLVFKKDSGARIEILCLEPYEPSNYIDALNAQGNVLWLCLVGNKKKWKGQNLKICFNDLVLQAELVNDNEAGSVINFKWNKTDLRFYEVLEIFGKIPLPPYIQRQTENEDAIRYQTVYAYNKGSVAAPTAGLHFTPKLLEQLKNKGYDIEYLTLHISAGTFKPLTVPLAAEHKMHHEWISISKKTIEKLYETVEKPIISVGTTSVRSLESLFCFGKQLINNTFNAKEFYIDQWFPYYDYCYNDIGRKEVLLAILEYMNKNNLENISGTTELMIIPGYKFHMTDVMVTNFHQSGSTLLMLVAAFIGDKWKDIYSYALENDFRFLSYGDACLLYPLI